MKYILANWYICFVLVGTDKYPAICGNIQSCDTPLCLDVSYFKLNAVKYIKINTDIILLTDTGISLVLGYPNEQYEAKFPNAKAILVSKLGKKNGSQTKRT
jgi:hypothetical protein